MLLQQVGSKQEKTWTSFIPPTHHLIFFGLRQLLQCDRLTHCTQTSKTTHWAADPTYLRLLDKCDTEWTGLLRRTLGEAFTALLPRQVWWGSVQTGQRYLKEKSFALHARHTGGGEHIALHPVWIFQEHLSGTWEKCSPATGSIDASAFSSFLHFWCSFLKVHSHFSTLLFISNFRINNFILLSQHWCH